eukprot:TRINITY_DN19692_c0_g2_i1.p1 TRINITY_DN19692_c0_g2~~TRINITY_DN19692_c0_g2_i1.p1  ORF type:complete len:285 (+),score=76.80 TRINITY_DN19692_c0_g2_i1:78-932(+)
MCIRDRVSTQSTWGQIFFEIGIMSQKEGVDLNTGLDDYIKAKGLDRSQKRGDRGRGRGRGRDRDRGFRGRGRGSNGRGRFGYRRGFNRDEGQQSGKQPFRRLTPRARLQLQREKRSFERRSSRFEEREAQRRTRPVTRDRKYDKDESEPREEIIDEERGKRIRVSNLDKNVTNSELFDLFSRNGHVVKCGIQFDQLGRSTGVAYVTFEKTEAAKKAIEAYNETELDGLELSVRLAKEDERLQSTDVVPIRRERRKPASDDRPRGNGYYRYRRRGFRGRGGYSGR